MNTDAILQINGRTLGASLTAIRPDADRMRRGTGYTRIFVSTPDPEVLGQSDGHPPHTRKGDDKAVDKAWRAYNKLEKQNQLATILAVFPELEGRDLRFSRYAGCSCPCSPGWVLRDRAPGGIRWYDNVWVKAELPVDPAAAAREQFLADAVAFGAVV